METPLVAVVISAENELAYMEDCERTLIGFGIPYESRVLSIHQAPEHCLEWSRQAAARGVRVIIAGASWSAPLATVISSLTTLPVIAVPLPVSPMHGFDSLMGMAQSYAGAPVATMAIGKPGAANAALLAVRILSLQFPQLGEQLKAYRASITQQVEGKDAALLQDRQRRRLG
jgi:phosphoribosylaminoimidazole carboxylase PurE protein